MNSLAQQSCFTIWYEPRATIRRIVDSDARNCVIALVVISGVIGVLGQWAAGSPISFNIGTHPIHFFQSRNWRLFNLVMLGAVPLSGIVMLYVDGALVRWAGGLFGGNARSIEVRAAIAWSLVPSLVAASLYLGAALAGLVHGRQFPELTRDQGFATALLRTITPFAIISVPLGVWSLIARLQGIGEVHHFSAWKALATQGLVSLTLLAGALLIGIIVSMGIVVLHIGRSASVAPAVPKIVNRPLKRITPAFIADPAQLRTDLVARRFNRLNQELTAYVEQAERDPR